MARRHPAHWEVIRVGRLFSTTKCACRNPFTDSGGLTQDGCSGSTVRCVPSQTGHVRPRRLPARRRGRPHIQHDANVAGSGRVVPCDGLSVRHILLPSQSVAPIPDISLHFFARLNTEPVSMGVPAGSSRIEIGSTGRTSRTFPRCALRQPSSRPSSRISTGHRRPRRRHRPHPPPAGTRRGVPDPARRRCRHRKLMSGRPPAACPPTRTTGTTGTTPAPEPLSPGKPPKEAARFI